MWFECRRPTALNICEVYFRSTPDRICFLRPDSLALLLNLANLSFTSKVLLVENTKGFLAGALIERCVAYALRVEFHENMIDFGTPSSSGHNTVGALHPKLQVLREFNFRGKHTRRLGFINASVLMNDASSPDPIARQLALSHANSYNSCIIVHEQFLPLEIYKVVAFCVQPSAPIVVFCGSLEPLIELQEYLLSKRLAINVRIEELFTRVQQVLPCRTHPNMNMHSASGYILSAIKISA